MTVRACEYYLNADFDLSLQPGGASRLEGAAARLSLELGAHGWLVGADRGASMLTRAEPTDELLEFLSSCGLHPPKPVCLPSVTTSAELRPFGWNRETARINARYARPNVFPALSTIREVNAKSYAHKIEREHLGKDEVGGVCDKLPDVLRLLKEENREQGWVAKGNHGNAGLANRRIRAESLDPTDERVILGLIKKHGAVVIEPWHRRLVDLCCIYNVSPFGELEDFSVHEVVNTADGAFIGSLFDSVNGSVDRWSVHLHDAALIVASVLAKSGYFGPVCQDAYVFEENGREHLRPLVDLNARDHFSSGARRQWRLWESENAVFWRLFKRRKLRLPSTLKDLNAALARDAFDPETRRGVLPTTDLWFRHEGRREETSRFGVLFCHQNTDGVFQLERRFRSRFES